MIGPVERRLVTDFAELRIGICVVGVCQHCDGAEHEGMLISFRGPPDVMRPRFDLAGKFPAHPRGLAVGTRSVAGRLVYRLVDPALEPADQYAEDLEVVAVKAAERARRRAPSRERWR